jgi:hypothetical protein
MVALILLVLAGSALYQIYRYRRRNRYRRQALKQLDRLIQYRERPTHYLQQLNYLLKQTALASQNPSPVADLTGQPWLEFLDRSGNCTEFCQGPGSVLSEGPYSKNARHFNPDELQRLARQWIKTHKNRQESA